MSRYFASLDVNNNEIFAVAGFWKGKDRYVLVGFCRVNALGFSKGMVTDVSLAIDSIRKVLLKLKNKTKKNIRDIYVLVTSNSIKFSKSSGIVLLSKYGKEINSFDVNKCIKIGSTVKIDLDREILHKSIANFYIDEERELKNPIGLNAVKLAVKVNIISIYSSVISNMAKCISQAGFVPLNFVFSVLASSYRVLTEKDMQKGTAVFNICQDVTEVIFFYDGIIKNCKVFLLGTKSFLSSRKVIDKKILKKLFEDIKCLDSWKYMSKIVVIGEGMLFDNLLEEFEKVFEKTVVVGTCIVRMFENLPLNRIAYIGCLGALDYLKEQRIKKNINVGFFRTIINLVIGFIDKYF